MDKLQDILKDKVIVGLADKPHVCVPKESFDWIVSELERQQAEIEHILGEVRWYAGKDNFYTIQQSLKEFREGGKNNG